MKKIISVCLVLWFFVYTNTIKASSELIDDTTKEIIAQLYEGKYKQAKSNLNKYLYGDDKIKQIKASILYASYYRLINNMQKSADYIKRAIDISEEISYHKLNPDILIERGIMHYESQAFYDAYDDLNKVVNYYKSNTSKYKYEDYLSAKILELYTMVFAETKLINKIIEEIEPKVEKLKDINPNLKCLLLYVKYERYQRDDFNESPYKYLNELKNKYIDKCRTTLFNKSKLIEETLQKTSKQKIGSKNSLLDEMSQKLDKLLTQFFSLEYKDAEEIRVNYKAALVEYTKKNNKIDVNTLFKLINKLNITKEGIALSRSLKNEQKDSSLVDTINNYKASMSKLLSLDKDSKEWRLQRSSIYNSEKQLRSAGIYLNSGMYDKDLTLQQVQNRLNKDEAILMYLYQHGKGRGAEGMFSLCITKDISEYKFITDLSDIESDISAIRKSLSWKNTILFPVQRATNLYNKVVRSHEDLLSDVKTIYLLPDGPFHSLPFEILVDRAWDKSKLLNYKKVSWLVNKYSFQTLNSLSSFNADVNRLKYNKLQSLLGVGNPILSGNMDTTRGININHVYDSKGKVSTNLIAQLPSLPETEEELIKLSTAIKTNNNKLLLDKNANEKVIKSMDLKSYDIIVFATHALVTGELAGLNQPGIVLTPPKYPTKTNDGILTISEISKLELDAELVILSACNTNYSDYDYKGTGINGLSESFIFAGAKRLLVSHWPVHSKAALQITTRMLSIYRSKKVSLAEAFNESLREAIDKYPSPVYWAPFSLVGTP
ncbi:MAG: CHAT domain-containing protein [Candidatus Thiodiazotropha taylori]|nr:CHAT domain-containing protein [Candidatus Thiodiazotropha taylori]